MKKLIAVMILLGLLGAMAVAKTGTWDGWVSDTQCGAKVDKACSKKCVEENGAELVFVSSDKTVIQVTNPAALKGHEGDHVKVTGTLEKGMLTVSSVQPIK